MNEPLMAGRTTAQAGWYPDPWAPDSGAIRWWDGVNWSPEHVRAATTLEPRTIEHLPYHAYLKRSSRRPPLLPVVATCAVVALAVGGMLAN